MIELIGMSFAKHMLKDNVITYMVLCHVDYYRFAPLARVLAESKWRFCHCYNVYFGVLP